MYILDRFSDVSPDIRMITVNSALELLTANPELWPRLSGMNLVANSHLKTSMLSFLFALFNLSLPPHSIDALKARVHDLDGSVRQSALRVLATAACSKPVLIRRDLIDMIVDRCLDKKVSLHSWYSCVTVL